MSTSAAGPNRASGGSSSDAVDESSSSANHSSYATKALEAASRSEGPIHPPAEGALGRASADDKKETGWLVTSCDVGTAEPQSLSEELERLQVLKSYHIMDPERDEAIDRLTRLASRVLETPYTFLSLVDMGRIWFRGNPDSDCETQLTRDILSALARVILKHDDVFGIPDINLDDMFRQGSDSSSMGNATADSPGTTQFRFFAGAPLMSPEGYRLGAICMLETEPRSEGVTEKERDLLKDFAEVTVKTMVDRRKLTTQGSPSHLVACTAHDLITPLTGIQLSLSLLQQDAEFQAKLGEKRQEHISAAVRSSNMMLRICQSTIETLRGNRKLPAATDWSLPRNLMQIAEASPFIDMKDFTANLVAISNSIPKRAKLEIILDRSAPTNIVSDGLKIFRSALNLLSNACSRADSGRIVMTIFDDQDGSLAFECEDGGKEVEIRDGQTHFNQETESGNFGLYSVAYQINWLGGKYGVRRGVQEASKSFSPTNRNGVHSAPKGKRKSFKSGDNTRTIFWFSIPIVLPQDVSELMGLAKSLSAEKGGETSIPTFKAELPVTPPASPQLGEYQEGQSPNIPKGIVKETEATRTLNALIIEDSTTVRKILGRALSKLGYQVFEAVDGMEGLRELKTTMFDMVLCDFLMPVMDGLDCVKQYREWEVTNRQSFRQYIVGISAHASRNDIERGLKLGMDDFKPKPIVLKTLTGLHESAPLRGVRSTLDNLLNLPSLEVKSRLLDTFTIPAPPMKVGGDNGDRSPLFAIPGPKEVNAQSKEPDKSARLFAVPRRPSQMEGGKPPLFSIPPELTEAGRRSPKAKKTASAPLFSIPPKVTNSGRNSPKAAAKPAPLFSIPSSQGISNQKPHKGRASPGPLFSIPAKKNDASQSAKKGPSPLFSISVNPTESEPGKNSSRQTKPSPLFSIPINPTKPPSDGANSRPALFALSGAKNDGAQSNAKKPALFTIPINTTSTEGSETKKPVALFSIPGTTAKQRETKTEAKKTVPLFSISSRPAPETDGQTQTESKPPPLFALPNNLNSTDGNSHSLATKPALFTIPINPTAETGMAKKETPLFDMSGDKNGQETGRAPKRPALFAIAGKAGSPDHVAGTKRPALFAIAGKTGSPDHVTGTKRPALFAIAGKSGSPDHVAGTKGGGSETSDGSARPKKAMKKTLSSG